MNSSKYFMKFEGGVFEKHVIDKFHSLFPDMIGSIDLKQVLKHIKIRTISGKFRKDGLPHKRYTKGLSNFQTTGAFPASLPTPLTPTKVDEMCRTQQGPPTIGLKAKYSRELRGGYHTDQRELLSLLEIACDEEGYVMVSKTRITLAGTTTTTDITTGITTTTATFTVSRERRATTEEFVRIIDNQSRSVMAEYKASDEFTESDARELEQLTQKIDLCLNILVKRLLLHQDKMGFSNDFMTEEGWKVWREHTWVAASFAVYYLSMHLYHKRKYKLLYQA